MRTQVVDNVFQAGNVSDLTCPNEMAEGVRILLKLIQGDKEVDTTAIQTVGEKGHDGFLYAIRK